MRTVRMRRLWARSMIHAGEKKGCAGGKRGSYDL